MTDEANTEQLPAKGKSIIDPKYRDKYKSKDWLATFIGEQASQTKVIPAKPATEAVAQVGEIGKEGFKPAKPAQPATEEKTVHDGVDTEKLFELGTKNGLDLSKFQTQRESHGFEGRFRMTVRNMLQTVVKQRHGLKGLDDKFHSAPADFLHAKSAPAKPTHDQHGVKHAVEKAPKEAKAEPESKLIKAPTGGEGETVVNEDAPAEHVGHAEGTVKKTPKKR